MSTWYREIAVLQEPFDMGPDERGRQRVGFNVLAVKRPSATFPEELITLLVAAAVGTKATASGNIFLSTGVSLPAGDGPYLSIIETGGTAPLRTQNAVATPAYQRPSAQIVVRAATYTAARTMARAAYNALVGVRNRTVSAA